jgi:hypothetical protein
LTAEPQPRTRFRKAIEGRWLFHAELAAREVGNLTLAEALDLVCLYAEVEPAKFEKAALRWLARYVTESKPSLLRAQIALAALGEQRRPELASDLLERDDRRLADQVEQHRVVLRHRGQAYRRSSAEQRPWAGGLQRRAPRRTLCSA